MVKEKLCLEKYLHLSFVIAITKSWGIYAATVLPLKHISLLSTIEEPKSFINISGFLNKHLCMCVSIESKSDDYELFSDRNPCLSAFIFF